MIHYPINDNTTTATTTAAAGGDNKILVHSVFSESGKFSLRKYRPLNQVFKAFPLLIIVSCIVSKLKLLSAQLASTFPLT